MKKNLETFVKKVKQNHDGSLAGGFGSVKGGHSSLYYPTNDKCNNTDCHNTNSGCTNSWQCSSTSNSAGCTNSWSCRS